MVVCLDVNFLVVPVFVTSGAIVDHLVLLSLRVSFRRDDTFCRLPLFLNAALLPMNLDPAQKLTFGNLRIRNDFFNVSERVLSRERRPYFEFWLGCCRHLFYHPRPHVRGLVFVLRLLCRFAEGVWMEPFDGGGSLLALYRDSECRRPFCRGHGGPAWAAGGHSYRLTTSGSGARLIQHNPDLVAILHFFRRNHGDRPGHHGMDCHLDNRSTVVSGEEGAGGRCHFGRHRGRDTGLHTGCSIPHQQGGVANYLSGYGVRCSTDQLFHGYSISEEISSCLFCSLIENEASKSCH